MLQEDFLERIVENQSNGFIILNKELVVLYANSKVRNFFVSDVEDTDKLLGNYLKCNYTVKENVKCQETSNCKICKLNNAIRNLQDTKEIQNLDNLKYNSDGKYINLTMKMSYIEEYIVLEFTDLCDLYEEINFLSRMMDKSKDIMFFKDNNLKYKYLNKSCAEFFDKEKNEILNKDDNELVEANLIDKSLYLKFKNSDLKTLNKGHYSEVLESRERYFRVSKEIIEDGILCIAKDITKEVEATKRAEIDSLTKLYNRRKFENTMKDILNSQQKGYYLALIDLDDLRILNNNYGHLRGDKYLSKLGEILNKYKPAMFFRIGGDEFAGIINESKCEVEYILKNIFEELESLNFDPPLSISVGVKEIDINKNYIENYKASDCLLYKVKESNKSNFIIK